MSAPSKTEPDDSFAECIERLFRELERAFRWHRPAILLAIYSSEYNHADAEARLTARLCTIDQTVTAYRVTGEENADIPMHIAEHPDRARTVFFVSGLRWGGGTDGRNAYRALNIRREYFVNERIRAVFWLTESEAVMLPSDAPDFWAFRHRVVEFTEPPQTEQIGRTASELIWQDWEGRTLRENTDAKIELREALLRDLPEGDETLSARSELLYTLASLYWVKGDYKKSRKLYQSGLKIAEQIQEVHLQARCYNGLGSVYRRLGQTEKAIAAYQCATELDPKYAIPYGNLGNVYRDLGRAEEALNAYQHAIEIGPKFAHFYNGLGNVYRDLGYADAAIVAIQRAIELDLDNANFPENLGFTYRIWGQLEKAITAYQRAIELDQHHALARMGLAACYRKLGRETDYAEQIALARPLMEKENEYNRACFEAIQGNVDNALVLLEAALQKNQESFAWARRDPDLEFIRDDPSFKILVGE